MNDEQLALAERVYDQILSHPETHNQDTWGTVYECNTTYCVAGWACEFAGFELVWNKTSSPAMLSFAVREGILPESPGDIARELLGLTHAQAERLFMDSTDDKAIDYLGELIKDAHNARH